MVNDIADSISAALNETFSGAYPIYSEEIMQGQERPCFFIQGLSVNQRQIIGGRYYREHAFDVHYYPVNGNREMHGIANELYEALEYVKLLNDGLLRGTNMRHEVIDGVLHFFVNYNMFMKPEVVKENMEELIQETDIKPR